MLQQLKLKFNLSLPLKYIQYNDANINDNLQSDTQNNDTRNDTQYSDKQLTDIQPSDNQNNDIWLINIQHNDAQQNYTHNDT